MKLSKKKRLHCIQLADHNQQLILKEFATYAKAYVTDVSGFEEEFNTFESRVSELCLSIGRIMKNLHYHEDEQSARFFYQENDNLTNLDDINLPF